MQNKKTYTVEEAKRALENYCVYQDRCHKEVEEKLAKMGMIPQACEVIILHLMEHNFLNEERFSKSFARGKFRIKKYGKVRITQELKFRNISDYNIKTALKEIDENEYIETLYNLSSQKWESTKESNFYKKKKKVADFLLRKGYESSLIYEALSEYNQS
ncbi:recombinase RecX [Wenyingzhuangia fucanilytica]|uniref:Regulatory protein RecX n=1 Tax=Wenyingzhuangia fucanilytica TaxID=1790137 RepID=A0A1B1Y870_9FLAO|nr:regulatory protein RecX [Wenyingzhuangia fucanilytica]ANW96919.1 recombinase RecX [Wenyingzhuangia fucanilytica]